MGALVDWNYATVFKADSGDGLAIPCAGKLQNLIATMDYTGVSPGEVIPELFGSHRALVLVAQIQ